jgi:hypothetical protein
LLRRICPPFTLTRDVGTTVELTLPRAKTHLTNVPVIWFHSAVLPRPAATKLVATMPAYR